MKLYQKSIALFGFAVPALLAGMGVGGLLVVKSRVDASFQEKLRNYKGFEQNKIQALAIEAEISRKRQHVQRWEKLVSEETPSTITMNLREIEESLPSKEFQKTSQDHPAGKAGFAAVSAQGSGQVRLSFRATYRSMQRALAALESRMPQLQLQEMRIDPTPNSGSLNVSLGYTAWEK